MSSIVQILACDEDFKEKIESKTNNQYHTFIDVEIQKPVITVSNVFTCILFK